MPTADEILDELRAHRRDLHTLFAARKEEDEDAARKHEEDAKRHEEEAMRHQAAAKKAHDDDDEEDAKRHDEDAKKSRMNAARSRENARKQHESDAKKAREEDDEDAAKHHEAEAARMKDEDAAAAKKMHDEDEDARRHEEETAAKRKSAAMAPLLAMVLRAMHKDGEGMEDIWHHVMDAMVYPAAPHAARRNQAAAHDDTAEDTALFKRLMKQYKEGDEMSAGRNMNDLRIERKLRSIEAAMGAMSELLTDVVHTMKTLATDTAATGRGLSTDTNRNQNGGPVRRTMSATGGGYRGKFDTEDGVKEPSMTDIDAALDEQGLDTAQRIAAKLTMIHGDVFKS